jgi:hypothetical protein
MNDKNASWEAVIRETAASFPYPPTPDVAAAVRGRIAGPVRPSSPVRVRLAWAIALLLLIVAGVLAVPQARAAVFEIIRAGAIIIFAGEPTPAVASPTPLSQDDSSAGTAVFELAGRTTLEEAQAQVSFPLRIPLAEGMPAEVYLQKLPDPGLDEQVVIMLWRDPAQPERVRLRLHQIGSPYYGLKQASISAVTQTEVNGQPAYWLEGGHRLLLENGPEQESYFVEGNVLIWADGTITYRLESELSLEEAVHIAESLYPLGEAE